MADRSVSVPMTLSDLKGGAIFFQAELLNNARTVGPPNSAG